MKGDKDSVNLDEWQNAIARRERFVDKPMLLTHLLDKLVCLSADHIFSVKLYRHLFDQPIVVALEAPNGVLTLKDMYLLMRSVLLIRTFF